VVNGTVALLDSLGAVVARAASDEEGRFSFNVPQPGRYSILAGGLGYRSSPSGPFSVEAEGEITIDLSLNPEPLELPGFDVMGGTFQERMERVEAGMDLRLSRQPGISRMVDAATVRRYDSVHAKDPWKLLAREFDVMWDPAEDYVRTRSVHQRRVTPEVYVDDRRTWLLDLVLLPNVRVCRVEVYEPRPEYYDLPDMIRMTMAPFQVRAYTCRFLSKVATGVQQMRSHLNWGDLIAGPPGGGVS
jgi:hypothetical protein